MVGKEGCRLSYSKIEKDLVPTVLDEEIQGEEACAVSRMSLRTLIQYLAWFPLKLLRVNLSYRETGRKNGRERSSGCFEDQLPPGA